MTNNSQQNPDGSNAITTEKKAWVAPALKEEAVSETKSGANSALTPHENILYHS